MARIFYSLAGEGRGHAARVHTLLQHLRHEHEIVVFAPDDAFEFLTKLYPAGGSDVDICRIPGLRFRYRGRQIDFRRTALDASRYVAATLGETVDRLARRIDDECPDLVITDFEPALPRAAVRCGVPFVSVDHQHFLLAYDLSGLPFRLRQYARAMAAVTRVWHPEPEAVVVTAFFTAPLKPGYEHVTQVGPILRSEVTSATPSDGDYLLAYLREHTPERVLECLSRSGRDVRVYGLGARPAYRRLRFHALDAKGFADDLAGCAGLVAASGNQLLGEALYLGKPLLAIPEAGLYEQRINAHFLRTMGCGNCVTLERFSESDLQAFLDRRAEFRSFAAAYRGVWNGTPLALAAVRRRLQVSSDGQHRAPTVSRRLAGVGSAHS
jgi:uncharacterized protein (TIGR00661 family)